MIACFPTETVSPLTAVTARAGVQSAMADAFSVVIKPALTASESDVMNAACVRVREPIGYRVT